MNIQPLLLRFFFFDILSIVIDNDNRGHGLRCPQVVPYTVARRLLFADPC